MKVNFTRLAKQFLGLFPSALPTGVTAFHAWADDIRNTYDLPTQDEASIKFTLSTIIMHLGPQVAHKPKYYFVLTLRASAAKQIAGQVFTDIKTKAAEEAHQAKAAAEAREVENEIVQQAV